MQIRLAVSTFSMISLLVFSSSSAFAAEEHAGHGAMQAAAPAANKLEMVEGTVKKIDKASGRVTLAHGPMMDMPAMTMAYRVKDAAWLDQIKEGDKIRFAVEQKGGAMIISQFEKAK